MHYSLANFQIGSKKREKRNKEKGRKKKEDIKGLSFGIF
jgi:hypothetical protein